MTYLTNEDGEYKHSQQPEDGHEDVFHVIAGLGVLSDAGHSLRGEIETPDVTENMK